MALGEITQFTRIIELTIISDNGKEIKIPCPKKGRKPTIEINATYASTNVLQPFNVTVMNLYLEDITQYAKIKLTLGYENNLVEMEGSITTIYQESPGPEGKTVIQCEYGGSMTSWLDATGQFYFEKGTLLSKVLDAIKEKIGANHVTIGDKAAKLSLEAPFEFDGTARGAMAELQKNFEDKKLYVFLRNDTLCALCITTEDYIASHKLEYTSAPVQPNAGTSDGSGGYMTVTAPWIPQLSIGDRLEIPARVYMRYLTAVNKNAGSTIFMQVSEMSIHFGTTRGVNSMTVKGPTMKGNK